MDKLEENIQRYIELWGKYPSVATIKRMIKNIKQSERLNKRRTDNIIKNVAKNKRHTKEFLEWINKRISENWN